jgi:hypothetical protein
MPYVCEKITESDKTRIGLDALWTEKWRRQPSDWVIDQNSGSWLYSTFWGDEDNRLSEAYIFFWENQIYHLIAEINSININNILVYKWCLLKVIVNQLSLKVTPINFDENLKLALLAKQKAFLQLHSNVQFQFITLTGESK